MSAPTQVLLTPQATSTEIAALSPLPDGAQVFNETTGQQILAKSGVNQNIATQADITAAISGVTPASIGAPTDAGVGATGTWPISVTGSATPSGSASGDLSGSYPSPTVSKINGHSLTSTLPTAGNLLIGTGASWNTEPMTGDATITSSGALTVSKINGHPLGSTIATSGNILIADGTTWNTEPVSGDATLSSTGTLTLDTVNAGVGTFGSASQSATLTVNAKGLITAASNTTITPAAIGAPTNSGTGATGTWPISVTGNSATVTTNANLTGVVNSVGNATTIPNGNITDVMMQNQKLNISGGTLTGNLILNSDATLALQAVTLQQLNAAATGIYRLQGGYDPTITSLYPIAANTTNPISATVNQGMVWQITANGNINGILVYVGDQLTALVNNPGQTNANWNILAADLGFTPISNVLPSSQILVGNASNVATAVSMTGDGTISNSGALTVTKINGSTLGTTTATSGNILIGNGTQWETQPLTGAVSITSGGVTTVPGRFLGMQFLTTSGTYTPTVGAVTAVVYAVGGGAGGGGSGTAGAPGGVGGAGGNTTFGAVLTSNGGSGGLNGATNPGRGGTTGGTSNGTVNFQGAQGFNGTGTGVSSTGGNGAPSFVGGGGQGGAAGAANAGSAGQTGTGSGGGGASGAGGSVSPGGGGSAGGFGMVVTPAVSTAYTIGNGGTAGAAGTSGAAGGIGGKGSIYVFEYS